MSLSTRVTCVTTFGIMAALSGCTESAPSGVVYNQYIVHLHGTDEPTVTTRSITREEQAAQVAARERMLGHKTTGVLEQAITQDDGSAKTACGSSPRRI
jgi:hypothetical protein